MERKTVAFLFIFPIKVGYAKKDSAAIRAFPKIRQAEAEQEVGRARDY